MARFEIQSDIVTGILGVLIMIVGLGLIAVNYEGLTGFQFGLFFLIIGHGFITNAKIRSLRRDIKELEAKVKT